MRKMDQADESKIFIAANKSAIDIQFNRLKDMAKTFLADTADALYPKSFTTSLHSLIEQGELMVFACQLRSNHFPQASLHERNRYWAVIDAINALFDAIGAYWPYVTQEIRAARLMHSVELMNEFEANVFS